MLIPFPLKTTLDPLLSALLVESALEADAEIFIRHSTFNYFAVYVNLGTKNSFPCFVKIACENRNIM